MVSTLRGTPSEANEVLAGRAGGRGAPQALGLGLCVTAQWRPCPALEACSACRVSGAPLPEDEDMALGARTGPPVSRGSASTGDILFLHPPADACWAPPLCLALCALGGEAGAQPAGAEVGSGGRAKEVGEETRRPEALRGPSEEVRQGHGVRTHLGGL